MQTPAMLQAVILELSLKPMMAAIVGILSLAGQTFHQIQYSFLMPVLVMLQAKGLLPKQLMAVQPGRPYSQMFINIFSPFMLLILILPMCVVRILTAIVELY